MRELVAPPDAVVDPVSRKPRLGSYRGGLPPVDWRALGVGGARLVLRHKRWVYVAIATEGVYVAVAVVRLGYASNAFAYAYDVSSRSMLVRRSWMGPPGAATVGHAGGEGCRAAFHARGVSIAIERPVGSSRYAVKLEAGETAVDAELETRLAPPAIGAVSCVAPGRFDATEKRALLSASGELRVDGRRVPLDGGLAGYDFTSGLLARRTRWRWAFALGRAGDGRPLAFNLVEGFVGEAECAAWVGADLVPLAEGRFAFDAAKPDQPWRVATADAGSDLVMTPGAVHAERRNLLLVSSRFVQPCGAWTGSIGLPGGSRVEIARAAGVCEDQDVTW